MAIVLKPPQGLNVSPSLAFGSNVRIDWSLAPRGLKTFFLNSAQQLPDLVGGTLVYNTAGATLPVVTMTACGPAFDATLGTNNAVWVPVSGTGPAQCSSEAFVYYNGGNTYSFSRVSDGSSGSGTFDRVLGLDASGNPYFYIYDGSTNRVTGSVALTSGKFYHLVGTATGSTLNIYLNGQLAATKAAANGGYTGFSTPVFSQGWGNGPDGLLTPQNPILHTAFADQAWTADEVAKRYFDLYGFLIPAEGEMPALKAPAGNTPPFIPNSNDNFNVRQAAQRAAAALLIATQPFVPFNTPQVNTIKGMGWYPQLSKAAPVAKALPGSTFVPFNTAQVAIATPKGWQHTQSRVAPTARAIPTQATSFAVPANSPFTNFGWYNPLAGAPAVAKASPGHSTVPFNTAQTVVVQPKWGWLPAGGSAARVAVAWPSQATSFAVPPSVATTPTPGQFGWYSPLSKSAPVAQAKPGATFVPFNTVQIVISPQTVPLYQDAGYPQPRIVYHQSLFGALPQVAQASNTITGIGWFQPLGTAALTPSAGTRTQQNIGSTFVPLNTAQIQPAGISGMAWFQPLGVVAAGLPAKVSATIQGYTFVPFNTVQLTPTVSPDIHFKPFFATPGQLMNT